MNNIRIIPHQFLHNYNLVNSRTRKVLKKNVSLTVHEAITQNSAYIQNSSDLSFVLARQSAR